ncbi:GNAT family N-acetyltransferase [Streptomyces sp. SID8361]|uniref:GNAT family N-acetyltransferase n=1 Tax=Streptomyces TaxID=1883 RepID=UPI000B853E81|nr:GNAT family N-acetyltransferase [Streptomyces sp. SID8382]MYU10982.1 GNAT family N-acetyltransferase [Streptomyces sp. SID8361]MYX54254.1 GNAT family N-acetyltransferase [Streptomyces sp. SID8382]
MEPTVSAAGLDIRHFGHDDLADIRQTIIDLHAAAAGPDRDDDFKKKFPWFVDHWGGHPEFSCVIAFDGDKAVGFAYGAPANPGREWWREYLDPAPEKELTFSYSELAVIPEWRKQGVAERLTRTLMAGRDEVLVVLLVDLEHPRVQALYETWGFRKVGERQPFPDSPVFAVMLAELPLS